MDRMRFVATLALCAGLAASVNAQQVPEKSFAGGTNAERGPRPSHAVPARRAGSAAEAVAEQNVTQEFLEELIAEARARYRLPAIVMAAFDSETVYAQAMEGVRRVGTRNRVSVEDYFHIGSCAKSILATVAGLLVEQNRIAWDTGFFELYPALQAEAHPAYLDITLEDLLGCRAGIQPYTTEQPPPDMSRMEFIQALLRMEPAAEEDPNAASFEFLYSNASYVLASAMLEQVLGIPYEDFIDDFWRDHGVPYLYGWPNQLDRRNQPWGHLLRLGRPMPVPPDTEYEIAHALAPAGDMGLRPSDFTRYAMMHLQGLTGTGPFAMESMERIHFGSADYAMGLWNGRLAGLKYSAMDGTSGIFYARAVFLPEEGLGFTIMTNAGSTRATMLAIEWLSIRVVLRHLGVL